ncbi:GntR family transcriptional regulator [Halotalea alkalilenta]|uniref:GntR family transcriptional regulator n=1 Tax=Halotalea alkalilenta TaxID=376489 RepID=UPI000488FDEC|nr:GntR family transcriptional regulator [Halotalea alkalilenta]
MSSSILTPSADADARETRAEQVFHDLQRAIITGELAAGSKLSEPALASRYGISRGTLRAALHRLEGHRLVVREAHIGTRVVTLELSSLIELFQIRESLEGLACRLAAARMPASEIASLSRLLDQHAESPDFSAGRGYCHQEGDFDFHYRIVQASGNAALTQMLGDGLYQRLRIYRVQLAADAGRAPQAMIEHRRILEALAARDGELAELLMRRHIAASRHHIERRLSAQSSTEETSP